MKAVIRLYKCHDMDLLLLKMIYRVNLAETAKQCLKAYVDHANIVFLPCESPDPEEKYIYKKSQTLPGAKPIPFPAQSFVLRLKEDTEALYITFWKSIIPGYRTMFLKQLLRMYLRMPVLPEYLLDLSGLDHTEYLQPPVLYEIPLLGEGRKRQQKAPLFRNHGIAENRSTVAIEDVDNKDTGKSLLPDTVLEAKDERIHPWAQETIRKEKALQNHSVYQEREPDHVSDDAEELMNYMAAWIDE